MVRISRQLVFIFTLIVLTACAAQGPREEGGMVIGGLIGGLLGSEFGHGRGHPVTIIAGSLAGAAIGGAIGRSMDEQDRMRISHSLETVRTGVPSRWRNPDSHSHYTVVPTRTYYQRGTPCREYTLDAQIGGKVEQIYGTACRQADGSWKVQP